MYVSIFISIPIFVSILFVQVYVRLTRWGPFRLGSQAHSTQVVGGQQMKEAVVEDVCSKTDEHFVALAFWSR